MPHLIALLKLLFGCPTLVKISCLNLSTNNAIFVVIRPIGDLGFKTEFPGGRLGHMLTSDVLSLFDDRNRGIIGRSFNVSSVLHCEQSV